MARITGIGGIFFRSDNPQQAKEWYAQYLGFPVDQYGVMFERKSAENDQTTYLQWSVMSSKDKYIPQGQSYMINYTVDHLEEFVQELEAKGVSPVDKIEDTEFGKFVHILDGDGNKIELWEPPAAVPEEFRPKQTIK
jgi:predicted enzyme related to lactoylglutathione lyase